MPICKELKPTGINTEWRSENTINTEVSILLMRTALAETEVQRKRAGQRRLFVQRQGQMFTLMFQLTVYFTGKGLLLSRFPLKQ